MNSSFVSMRQYGVWYLLSLIGLAAWFPMLTSVQSKVVFILIGGVLGGWYLFARRTTLKPEMRTLDALTTLVVLFCGVVLLSWAVNSGQWWSFIGNMNAFSPVTLITLTLAFLLARVSIRWNIHHEKILDGVFFIIPTLQVLGMIASFISPQWSQVMASHNLFLGQLHDVALTVALSSIWFISKATFSQKESVTLYADGIAVGASLAILMFTNVLGIWGLLTLVSAMILFISLRKNGRLLQKDMLSVLVLVVSVISFFSQGALGSLLQNNVGISSLDVRPSFQSTVTMTKEVLTSPSLLLGRGGQGIDEMWQLTRNTGVNVSQFWNMRFSEGYSSFSSIIIKFGVAGIFILLLIGTTIAYRLKGKKWDELDVIILTIGVASLFLSVGVIPLFIGALILAVWNRNNETSIPLSSKRYDLSRINHPYVRTGIAIAGLLIASGALFVAFSSLRSVFIAQNAQKAFASQDIAGTEQALLESANVFPTPQAYLMLASFYDNQLIEVARNLKEGDSNQVQLVQQLLSQEIDMAQKAVALDPNNFELALAEAQALMRAAELKVEGASEKATDALERARLLSPLHPAIRLEEARLAVQNGDVTRARNIIRETFLLKPDYVEAALFLSQIELQSGKSDEALGLIEQSIVLRPQDPVLRFQAGLLRYGRKEFEVAAQHFVTAYALNNTFHNAAYLYALSVYQVGEKNEALATMDFLISLYADNEELVIVKRNMENSAPLFTGVTPPQDVSPVERDELPLNDSR